MGGILEKPSFERPSRARIRVLHVLEGIDVGGAESQVLAILTRLPRERFQVMVAWLGGRGEMEPDFRAAGIPTAALRMRSILDPDAVGRLLTVIRRFRPHLIHSHLIRADILAGVTGRLSRVKAVISTKHVENGARHHPLRALGARAVAALAGEVVVISDALAAFYGSRRRGRPRKISYGYEPRRGPNTPPRAGREEIIAELGLPADASLATMIGPLLPRKGLGDLLRAASLLKDGFPLAHLLLVGRGEQRRRLQALVRTLDIEDTVHFLGFRRDVDRILSGSDLLVLPSRWEGFGLVLLEAMNQGLPVVGTRRGAIPEVVRDGETGLLVPPGDPDSLATALSRLLGNPERAVERGRAGRTRLRREFDLDRAVEAHRAMYEELAAR